MGLGQLQRDNFARAVKAGVKVAFGTDAGVYPHGENARQFAYMVKYGLSPARAIRSATSDAAELLGRSKDIGRIAPWRLPRSKLRARLEALYPRVIAIEFGSARPAEVAFCSGSGNSAVPALTGAGVDTLVTGELREEWFNVAQERSLNLYLCGHYATEVHAVRALAAELSAKFGLPWEFIATENPL